MAVIELHRCPMCKEEKPVSEFPGAPHKVWRCRPCCRIYQAEWRSKNREKVRHYERKSQIGVTREQYEAALRPDCPICLRPFTKTPHADHDHETGEFRGVLCGPCNRALGLFGDSEEALARAIRYLRGET